MVCSKCGTDNQPNYKFCVKCGAPLLQQQNNGANYAQVNNNPFQQSASLSNGGIPQKGAGFAITSMVCGIVGLVISCCFPFLTFPLALISVIFGIVSLVQKRAGKGMAIAGLVCGIIGLIPAVFMLVSATSLTALLGSM